MTLLKRRILRIGAVSGAVLLAASCAETQLGAQAVKEVARSDAPSNASAPTGPELAPDAFDATGLTIWDGASTLEGVWVAHPLAQRAQRVRVTNAENGVAIEGAMFRRDPTLSGPSILVSSDAARLLGLQPGIPTELRIIALREGVYAAPATTAQTDSGAAEAGAVETTALAAPEPQESQEGEDIAAVEEEIAEAPAAEPPEAEAAVQPVAEAAEEPAAPEPAEDVAEQPAAPAPPVRQRERPKTAITAADLRGETTTVAAAPAQQPAAPAAPDQPAAEPAEPAPAAAPAEPAPTETARAEPTPAPTSSGAYQGQLPAGRFVQAGAFGVEPNAASLVKTLRGAGLPAQYVQRDVNGSALNIVMIGPLADDAAADAAIAAAAKAGAPGARKVIR